MMEQNGDPMSVKACDLEDDFTYKQRNASAGKIGVGTIIDEFGAFPNTEISRELLTHQLEQFSQDGHSWAYWMYKPFGDITTVMDSQEDRNEGLFNDDGTIQQEKLKILTHPYASTIAGTVYAQPFDFESKMLTLRFTTGKVGEKTEIVIAPEWSSFGNKKQFITGQSAVRVSKSSGKIILENLASN